LRPPEDPKSNFFLRESFCWHRLGLLRIGSIDPGEEEPEFAASEAEANFAARKLDEDGQPVVDLISWVWEKTACASMFPATREVSQ